MQTVLSKEEWTHINGAIELAKEALGDGPQDVDGSFLINSVLHLRVALTAAHKRANDLALIKW